MGGFLEDAQYWNTPLPAALVLTTMSEILQGLAHLHGLSAVHRDTKSENVLVAHSMSAPLAVKSVAPEMFLNRGYGTNVDCGAFGLITYWLLCGQLPRDATKKIDLEGQIQCKQIWSMLGW